MRLFKFIAVSDERLLLSRFSGHFKLCRSVSESLDVVVIRGGDGNDIAMGGIQGVGDSAEFMGGMDDQVLYHADRSCMSIPVWD